VPKARAEEREGASREDYRGEGRRRPSLGSAPDSQFCCGDVERASFCQQQESHTNQLGLIYREW
jgi:hypothetical protein